MTLEKLEELLDLLIRISTVFSLAGSRGSVLISQQFILTSFNQQGKIMDLFWSIQHLIHMQILENSHFDK